MSKQVDSKILGPYRSFLLRADAEVASAPRTHLLKLFLGWLAEIEGRSEELATQILLENLPREEILVELRARQALPRNWMGSFPVGSAASPLRRWKIVLAYGPTFTVGWGVEAWLATAAHELHHLAAYAEHYGGRLPSELHYSEFHKGIECGDEDQVEEYGNDVIRWDFRIGMPNAFSDPTLLQGIEHYVEGHAPTSYSFS